MSSRCIRLIIWGVLLLLGCAINRVGLPFIGDTTLLLGFFASALATLVLGFRYGLSLSVLVPILSFSGSIVYLAIVAGALETCVIKGCKKWRLSTVAVTSLFWVIIVPSVAYGALLLFNLPTELTLTQGAIRFTLSGLFSLSSAYIIARLLWTKRYFFLHNYPTMKYSIIITSMVLSIVIFATCLTSYVWLIEVDRHERMSFRQEADQSSQSIAFNITQTMNFHERAINQLANSVSTLALDSSLTNQLLDDVINENPGFITMLRTDPNGGIINAAPQFARDSFATGNHMNVSDRDYFLFPRATLQFYVSDVFRGRGFGNDIIIAMASPILLNNEFIGVLEGSLSLQEINTSINRTLPNYHHYVLVDRSQNVIFASPHISLSFGDSIAGSRLSEFLLNIDGSNDFYIGESQRVYVIDETTIPQLGWQLIVGVEPIELQNNLDSFANKLQFFILSALLGAILISRYLAKKITAPLQLLTSLVSSEKRFFSDRRERDADFSVVSELQALYSSVKNLRGELISSFQALENSSATNRDLSARLYEANRDLEKRVAQRTEQLRLSLIEAKEATLAKELFASSVSHEIKNPLNGILGTTDYLLQLEMDPKLRDKVTVIDRAGKDLLAFLEQILAISSSKFSAFNSLSETSNQSIIERVYKLVETSARAADVDFKFEVSPSYFVTNKVALQHILMNLVTNAVKYSKSSQVTIKSFQRETSVYFIIEDNGIGMPQAIADAIFSPHSVVNFNQRGGTGLGLYIVNELSQSIGGTIEYDREFKPGCRFVLKVPFVCPLRLTADSSQKGDTANKVNRHEHLAFVLDDMETNLTVVRSLFKLIGVTTETFNKPDELIARLEVKQPSLLLIDFQLGAMNGLEVAKQLCESGLAHKHQIYIVTGTPLDEKTTTGYSNFFTRIVQKPISSALLKQLLSNTYK